MKTEQLSIELWYLNEVISKETRRKQIIEIKGKIRATICFLITQNSNKILDNKGKSLAQLIKTGRRRGGEREEERVRKRENVNK